MIQHNFRALMITWRRPFVQHTHCSQVSDGGAAAIFMSEEAAAGLVAFSQLTSFRPFPFSAHTLDQLCNDILARA